MEMINVSIASPRQEKQVLLEQVSWRVQTGDFWVVGGLQSVGKSALLAVAVTLQRPVAGEHFVFGSNTAGLSDELLLENRLRMGLVFEHGGRLFTHMTVAENVALPLRYHQNCAEPEAATRVRDVLEAVELLPAARDRALHLGRDRAQRAGLARALALKPEVLFLDNPLAGLDPRERYWWLEFLSALSRGHPVLDRRPLTLVVAVNDLNPWSGRGRQFAFINQNRFLPVGGRKELDSCREPLLRELLAAELMTE